MALPSDSAIEHPKLEVGWLLVGRLDEADRRAAARARQHMRRYLRDTFPQFGWQFPTVARREGPPTALVEPVDLLDYGVEERDTRHWDFAFVITQAELRSYFKPYALGAPSQAVQVAVASTARIDPEALPAFPDEQPGEDTAERYEVLGHRLYALVMHLFGHLGDLDHADDPSDFMFAPQAIPDLDQMGRYSEEGQAQLLQELRDAADVRLEERHEEDSRRGRMRFYLRAWWQERRDIASAIGQIRPWTFPLQFSRLTTAAVSTLVILIMTAEAWELGMSQPLGRVALLSVGSLAATSTYLVTRQRLLSRRRAPRLSEQRVVAGTAVATAVGLGMATTYVLLFCVTLVLSLTFFSDTLAQNWSGSASTPLGWSRYLSLAGFIAALGLAIGALGASFEEQGYFRHVAFADEET